MDAIDYNFYGDIRTNYIDKINETVSLVKCEYFNTGKLGFNKVIERDYIDIDSFVIYMCCEGKYDLVYNDAEKVEVIKGETVLLPATLKYVRLVPKDEAVILEIHM